MSSRKVAIKYAQSLLDLAVEQNNVDVVVRDANFVLEVLKSNTNLIRTLQSPIIKSLLKQSILDEIFVNKVSESFISFIRFVVQKGRESILEEILISFDQLKNVKLGIAKVNLTTSLEVDDNQLEKIKTTLEGLLSKKVTFDKIIDASIIGGFVAQVDDKIYDASIKNQLELMKKQLVKGATTI